MATQQRSVEQVINLASAPASPAKGWLYFDTTSNQLFWYSGTAWVAATGGGASFATPAIVLGTAAAAGSASTVIRSDSTIVAFDTTVPTNSTTFDVAATGSAAVAARRDHVHGRERVVHHLKWMVE